MLQGDSGQFGDAEGQGESRVSPEKQSEGRVLGAGVPG